MKKIILSFFPAFAIAFSQQSAQAVVQWSSNGVTVTAANADQVMGTLFG